MRFFFTSFFLLFFFSSVCLLAQTDYSLEWERTSATSVGYAMVRNSVDGSIVRTGAASGSEGNEVFCLRYSEEGELLSDFHFINIYGSQGAWMNGVLNDEEGNFYYIITATASVYVSGEEPTQGTFLFIIKTSPEGELIWEKTYTKDDDYFARAFSAVFKDNHLYLSGSVAQYEGDNNVHYDEAFAVKMDTSGAVVWETFIPETSRAFALDVRQDTVVFLCRKLVKKDYLLTYLNEADGGSMASYAFQNSDIYADIHYTDAFGNHYFLQDGGPDFAYKIKKYAPDGDSLWTYVKEHSEPDAYRDRAKQLAFDSENNIYCIGTSFHLPAMETRLLLTKLDQDGNVLWETEREGRIERPGYFSKTFLVAGDRILIGACSFTEGSDVKNFLLLEYDSSGQFLQEIAYPNSDPTEDDFPGDMLLGDDGSLYVSGIAVEGGQPHAVLLKYGVSVSVEALAGGLEDLHFFPNPTAGFCRIEGEDIAEVSEVVVYNALGQRVQAFSLNGAQDVIELDISALPPACYCLSLKSAGGRYRVFKMVKVE